MSYRTNEWAKHLSNADSPDVEELGTGEKNIDESDIEAAAPLDVEALQQTIILPIIESLSSLKIKLQPI
ncbi:hypothetical protein CJF30_00000844 [Rutstroemia sp. NJR-2017a BBW]|nr:hypothetical protein CJF30_00000844 [Rutstroemia sp. NJR-2017a BBW]